MTTPLSIAQEFPVWAQVALVWVPAVSAAVACIGLLINATQLRRNNAQMRAGLVAACLKGFADDEGIQKAFYAVEYSKFRYGTEFHNSELERDIDKLLRHFANIALSWKAGLLTAKDIRPLTYYVLRITGDEEIRKYLTFIKSWSNGIGAGEHPYQVLEKLSHELCRR